MDFVVVPFLVGFFLLAYGTSMEESKNQDTIKRLFSFAVFVFIGTGLAVTLHSGVLNQCSNQTQLEPEVTRK
ncbi:MAG: hypothetical protein SAK29_02210 [Scytonema sp. PMC 1069.18]|nr:hypothetical protein [Scytonema sp. PMC 1069.18]MEC4882170.1 hypothetical protein [Scytonema sp. PMC 1070.18]